MNQKRNQGYQRTHENIRNCLYELLQKKSIDQITVGEICKEVGINRSTFYAHFQDVYEVLELIYNELNEEMLERYRQTAEEKEAAGVPGVRSLNGRDYIVIQLEHMRKYRWFYLILLRDPSNLLMVRAMKSLREQVAEPIFAHFEVPKEQTRYYFRFTVGGYFAIVQEWLESGCLESEETIAGIIEALQPVMPDNVFDALWK